MSVVIVSAVSAASYFIQDTWRQRELLKRSYGAGIATFVSFILPDTVSRYERVERDILNGSDENALTFRQTSTDECNMTAVAVSSQKRKMKLEYEAGELLMSAGCASSRH